MNRILVLVRGEFYRLNRYNLFSANLFVLLLWVVLAWFLEGEILEQFLPTVFLVDSVMMTVLLVGAILFYEKKEHTINSIMVTPVSSDEYLLAKLAASAINSLITVVFVSLAVYLLKGVTYNYLLLVPAVVLATVVHTLLGIRLSYSSKDFTSLLVSYIVYVFVFLLPSLLLLFGVISGKYADYLLLLPPEAAGVLIKSAFTAQEWWKICTGYAYLAVLSFLLYRYIVKPGFNAYVMKETGV